MPGIPAYKKPLYLRLKFSHMVPFKKAVAAAFIRRGLAEEGMSLEYLESRHGDPNEHLFNDSSYFLGRGEDGSAMVVRLAFRTRGHEYWLAVHLPGHGTFSLKDLEMTEGEGFLLGSLKYECLEPGRTWKISYKGKIQGQGKPHEMDLDLTFRARGPLVNFKDITDPAETAAIVAREKWTRDFFSRLKEIKKTHLEQGGRLSGTIRLDGEEVTVDWRSVRDHSWGIRVWGSWKRHVWLSGALDDGETFNLSMISYDFLGQLSAGYLSRGPELLCFGPLPTMESFASDPLIPSVARIEFDDRSGGRHNLQIKMPAFFDFTMDGEYFIREGMGDFILDGVPGKGVAEFGLNPKYYDHTAFAG